MTVGDVWGAFRRRWLVMLVGLLLTLVACLVTLRSPGVYWASTKLYFLVPATVQQPNQIAPNNSAAIGFAGIIMTELNGGPQPRDAISPDVTLVDQGIYDGWSVLLPDTGGQWADNFPESSLIVQASGPTAAVVQTRVYDLIDRITRLVSAREDAARVPATLRVDFTMSPPVVAVQYSNGHRSRAVVVIVLLGTVVSLAACGVVDRIAASRRLRGERTNGGIGDARVRDTSGGDQDGPGGEGAGASPGVASDRGGDRTASGDA